MANIISLPNLSNVPSDGYVEVQRSGDGSPGRLLISLISGAGAAPITPQLYGAAANGSTNDYSAIQQAINEAAAQQVPMLFPAGTYRCDSGLTLPSNSQLTAAPGALIDFSNASGGVGTLFTVTSGTETTTTLSAAASAGATTVTVVSTSGISSNTWLQLRDGSNSWASGVAKAELVQVTQVSGSTLTLARPLFLSYASGATVAAITFTDNISISGLAARGKSAGTQKLLQATRVRRIILDGCRATSFESGVADFTTCRNVLVRGLTAEQCSGGAVVTILGGSENVDVLGGAWTRVATGVTITGSRRVANVRIENVNHEGAGSTAPLYSGTAAADAVFVIGNVTRSLNTGTAAILHRGGDVIITANQIYGSVDNGIEINMQVTGAPRPPRVHVANNQLPVGGGGYGIYLGASVAATLSGAVLGGNALGAGWEHGVYVTASASGSVVQNVSIQGNTVVEANIGAVELVAGTSANVRNIAVIGNVLSLSGTPTTPVVKLDGMSAGAISNITIASNVITNGTYAVFGINDDQVLVAGNRITSMTAGALSLAGSASGWASNIVSGSPPQRWALFASLPGDVAGTHVLVLNAPKPFRVISVTYKTDAGTATLAVKDDGTNIGGLGSLSATSTEATTNATAPHLMAAGRDLSVVVSSPSGALQVQLTVLCEYPA